MDVLLPSVVVSASSYSLFCFFVVKALFALSSLSDNRFSAVENTTGSSKSSSSHSSSPMFMTGLARSPGRSAALLFVPRRLMSARARERERVRERERERKNLKMARENKKKFGKGKKKGRKRKKGKKECEHSPLAKKQQRR